MKLPFAKFNPTNLSKDNAFFQFLELTRLWIKKKRVMSHGIYLFLPDPTIEWFAICVFLKHHGWNADKSVINLFMFVRFSGKGRQMPNPFFEKSSNITLVNHIDIFIKSIQMVFKLVDIPLNFLTVAEWGSFLPFFFEIWSWQTRRGRVRSVRTGKAYSPKFHRPSGLSIGKKIGQQQWVQLKLGWWKMRP